MIPYNKRQDTQIVKIKDYINGKREYVTGEGTSLTLQNTANAPLSDIILKGNTSQQQYSGKNLFQTLNYSNSNWLGYSINADTKYIIISGSNTGGGLLIEAQNKIYTLKANTTYTLTLFYISGDITSGDLILNIQDWKNSDYPKFYTPSISRTNKKNVSITFTTNSTERTYKNCGVYLNNLTCSNLVVACQLEINSTATSYEPYTGGTASPNPDYPQDIEVVTGDNTITISNSDNTEKQELPISLGSLELCKIGDYQDYIYKNNGKWYKHKETNHILLDGVNVYFVNMGGTTNSGHYRFVLSNVENKFALLGENVDTKAKIFSNKLLSGTRGDTYSITNENVFAPPIKNDLSAYGNIGIVYISAISQMTLDNANAWLKDNNIDLYYVLATPTEEEITDTTLISQLNALYNAYTYNDTTNISQTNANLPFIINAEAVKKLL